MPSNQENKYDTNISPNSAINDWVAQVAELTQPLDIVLWGGTQGEYETICNAMVEKGQLIRLNEEIRPQSFLARSHASDVARVEGRTFICSRDQDSAGVTNNWIHPEKMRSTLKDLLHGAMRGRVMYVVPFSMGPLGGAITQYGIEITDSEYVVASMHIMTRAGKEILKYMPESSRWVKALHSVGYPLIDENGKKRADPSWPCNETKYIAHFPEDREIISFGSGYGGNALLGKKCFALRIASSMGKEEGWMAEHMLLIRATSPEGKKYTLAGAFPSATGKTNFAMLQPKLEGWKIETFGDDIVWMRPGEGGKLYAINPEYGFFGVAPGTGWDSNPIAMETIQKNTIFTNVALTQDLDVWWEGKTKEPPEGLIDWQGRQWSPELGTPAAHENARFTAPAHQCPSMSPDWEVADGIPVDAILFGGRRRTNVPLVYQSRSWQHGCFLGATLASERTAAAEGTLGELRRDPFAMLPFVGYNMADYFAHWLKMGKLLGDCAPRIFQVNWFRTDRKGEFLWPGFGDNIRVIDWIVKRLDGKAQFVESPIGQLPKISDLDLSGLDISEGELTELFDVDKDSWIQELAVTRAYFDYLGSRVPEDLYDELRRIEHAFNAI